MLLSALLNPAVDRVEVGLVDQECVVLRVDVLRVANPSEVEARAVLEPARNGPNSLAGANPNMSVK
jgi:hypothetical protein